MVVVALLLALVRDNYGSSAPMFSVLPIATAFQPGSIYGSKQSSIRIRNSEQQPRIRCNASGNGNDEDNSVGNGDSAGTQKDMDILTKSSWYAVEWFGKAFGTAKDEDASVSGTTDAPKSLEETLRRIQEDNDRSYFLSGNMDVAIYDPDCVFADPFVSFSGRDRFVENLQNLGSFITKYDAKVLPNKRQTGSGAASDDNVVLTRLMVKLELNLPWKPVLAWPWGVTYTIDPESFLITEHVESWEIEPLEGVKQILRKPTVKL